ncbi:MAG: addiction module protein [Pirellulales bacterium]
MSTEAWNMSAEGKYLLDAALRLPQRDREILADRLNASIDSPELDAGWEQAWSDELDRREAELDSGAVQPLSLDDVHRIMQEARHGKAGT